MNSTWTMKGTRSGPLVLFAVAIGAWALLAAGCSDASPAGSGAIGDACERASDCASGRCVGGACVDGEVSGSSSGAPPLGGTGTDASSTAPDASTGASDATSGASPGGFGQPCDEDAECADGLCLRTSTGRFCSAFCGGDEDCAALDWICTTVRDGSADVIEICYPDEDTLCQPCGLDSQCGGVADRCLPIGGGTFCGTDCSRDGRCPIGYICSLVDEGVEQCVPSSDICGDCQGVDFSASVEHCGGCGQACDTANGSPVCVQGLCEVFACDPGFGDCDGDPDSGCETATASDRLNCGSCGVECDEGESCREGVCVVDTCPPGTALCDGDESTGCETSILDDVDNCGGCGVECAAGPRGVAVCDEGECGVVCDDGFASCDGDPDSGCETNTRLDESNCGGCGLVCAEFEVCEAGVCVVSDCPAGRANCDEDDATGCEVDLRTDAEHCGACGAVCPVGASCVDGGCACPSGQRVCGDACVQPNACGGCDDLDGSVGAACDACGVLVCDGEEALRCDDPGANACDGCGTLEDEPGTSCGACGVWSCSGANSVRCDDPGTNACGGCATLDAQPGESCGDCGDYICSGTDAVVCDGPGVNTCGGCGVLDREPEGTCGYCDTGAWSCTGTNTVGCTGETSAQSDDRNCGECGTVCRDGRNCVGGTCVCPDNQVVISAQPANRSTCSGGGVTFSVGVAGQDLSYRWERSTDNGTSWSDVSNGGGYGGATTASLTIAGATVARDGNRYRVRVSGSCLTRTSNDARLTVNTAPTGVSASATPNPVCAGSSLSLSGSGSGASTWSWSGPGGFSSSNQSPTRTSIAASHAGVYTVTASNSCGEASASTATVVVNAATRIDDQPRNETTCAGSSATFSVSASGTGVSYRWQRSTNNGASWSNLSNGGAFSGATSSTLTVAATSGMNGHRFRAVVSADCGNVTSDSGTLLVNGPPTGVSASASPNPICVGQTLNLSGSASGATSWSWSGPGGYSSSSRNATRNNVTTSHAGTYTVRATNTCGSNESSTSSVTVNTAPTFNELPGSTSQTVCQGGNVTFAVSASGAGLSYRWQRSTNGGSSWSDLSNGGNFSGVTTATLSVSNAPTSLNGNQFRVRVTGTCGTVTSTARTLTVNASPSISSQPSNRTICQGASTTFGVSASGAGLSYRWQRSTNGGSSWSDLSNGGSFSGATTATLSVSNAATSLNGNQFRVRVTGTCGTVTSTARTLTVNTNTSITSHPAAQFIGAGQNASFSVGASGAGLTYQWQRRSHGSSTWTNVSNGGVYSGATTATLSLTNVPGSLHNTFFRARVSGSCGSTQNSNEAALRVISADNGCGGSDPLPNPPGTSCGTCGTYQCSGTNNTVCVGSTDTQTDPQNCGTCGNDCGPNYDCNNGTCACGFELCIPGSVCCDRTEFSSFPSFPKRCAPDSFSCASICSGMFEP